MPVELPKWKQVVRAVKDLIVSGVWKPGEKLPTYDELEIKFKVSRLTLQQVMRTLKTEGFISARERMGLFVNPKHPFLTRLGIIFPYQEDKVTRFWEGLHDAAQQICTAQNRELATYWNLTTSKEELARLKSDIDNSLLSGLILPVTPNFGNLEEFLNAHSELPLIGAGEKFGHAAHFCRMSLDNRTLVCRALDFMQEQGCRRIPIMLNGSHSEIEQFFMEEIQKRGLYSPPQWHFVFQMETAELTAQITELLLSLPEREKPDGIFIGDDNLASYVVRGAVAKGVRLPDDFTLVSHYNWLPKTMDSLPVRNIGYNIKSMMENSIQRLDDFHITGMIEPELYVPPLFHEELKTQKKEKKYA